MIDDIRTDDFLISNPAQRNGCLKIYRQKPRQWDIPQDPEQNFSAIMHGYEKILTKIKNNTGKCRCCWFTRLSGI